MGCFGRKNAAKVAVNWKLCDTRMKAVRHLMVHSWVAWWIADKLCFCITA